MGTSVTNIGKVATCQVGKLGVITTYDSWRKIYYGVGFDGKAWQSKNPTILADNIQEYINNYNKYTRK